MVDIFQNQLFSIKQVIRSMSSRFRFITYSLISRMSIVPELSRSISFITTPTKCFRSSASSRPNILLMLLPTIRSISCSVKQPSWLLPSPSRRASSLDIGVFLMLMLTIFMNSSHVMNSGKQQMFRISYSPGLISSPFSPSSNVFLSMPFSCTLLQSLPANSRLPDIFSSDLYKLQRLQASARVMPYFSIMKGMFWRIRGVFFLSSSLRNSFSDLYPTFLILSVSFFLKSSASSFSLFTFSIKFQIGLVFNQCLLLVEGKSSILRATASRAYWLFVSWGKWELRSKKGFFSCLPSLGAASTFFPFSLHHVSTTSDSYSSLWSCLALLGLLTNLLTYQLTSLIFSHSCFFGLGEPSAGSTACSFFNSSNQSLFLCRISSSMEASSNSLIWKSKERLNLGPRSAKIISSFSQISLAILLIGSFPRWKRYTLAA